MVKLLLKGPRGMSPIIVVLILFMVMSISGVFVWWYFNNILQSSISTAQAASLSTLGDISANISRYFNHTYNDSGGGGGGPVASNGSVLYIDTVNCLEPVNCTATPA